MQKENDLTNLKLQKILYYAQAEYYKKHGSRLFNDEIEAWDLGPVVNNVYQWLKGCGAYPISSFDVPIDVEGLADDTKIFLDEIWKKYSKFSAYFLVNKTHDPSGPWEAIHSTHANGIIDLSELDTVELHDDWK